MTTDEKSKRLDQYVKFLRDEFQETATKSTRNKLRSLKIHHALPPQDIIAAEYSTIINAYNVYVEEYGFHLALSDILRDETNQVIRSKADLISLPVYLPSLVINSFKDESRIASINNTLQFISPLLKKRLLLSSPFDVSVRPILPFERSEFKLLKSFESDLNLVFSWIRKEDLVITFQSNLENWLHDIAAFPVPFTETFAPDKKQRQYLYSFLGKTTAEHWPRELVRGEDFRSTWNRLKENLKEDTFIGDGSDFHGSEKKKINNYLLPRVSTFTLCPRGIGNWTFRLFEAIRGGSIPIILADSYIKPFSNIIPWDEFSITIPESNLAWIDEMIRRVDKRTTTTLKEGLKRNQKWFTMGGLMELIAGNISIKLNQ